jgi:tRNA(Ile)-lysidine synthase
MTDQAETLFMRLLRGSGTRGLGGIYPMVDKLIIRPLIELEREDIKQFLSDRKISYRTDESNFDKRYLRNRIRHELIPFIKEKYEPKIVHRLGVLSSILRDEDQFLENAVKEEAERVIFKRKNRFFLDLKSSSSLPSALRRRVVREFIWRVKGDLRSVSFSDVESLLRLGEGKDWRLTQNLILSKEDGLIFLKTDSFRTTQFELAWSGRERLEIRELGLEFEGKLIKKDKFPAFIGDDNKRVLLDFAKLVFPLRVRNRKAGDRYRPLGSPGKKKLKEIMRAKSIVLSKRDTLPVFFSEGQIVWVLGLPVSENYKVKDETAEIFMIQKT